MSGKINAEFFLMRVEIENSREVCSELGKQVKLSEKEQKVKDVEIVEPDLSEEDWKIMEERHQRKDKERRESFKRMFEIELKRQPTTDEIEDYFYNFDKERTNFWKFINSIMTKEKEKHL